MNAKSLCNICFECFNKVNRKPVCCLYCSFEACQICCQQYLLTKTIPGCMNNECHQEWTQTFLLKTFSKTFLSGDFRKHRENLCFDTEKALLPTTQIVVEHILRYEKQIKDRETFLKEMNFPTFISHIQKCLKEICPQELKLKVSNTTKSNLYFLKDYFSKSRSRYLFSMIKHCIEMFEHLYELIKSNNKEDIFPLFIKSHQFIQTWHPIHLENWKKLDYEISQLHLLIKDCMENRTQARERTAVEPRQFLKACPADECRGFLSTQWKCGLCHVKVCSKCHIIKTEEDHECHPDDVATAEFLMNDTKQCPKCPTRIHKIDGCDQMWCVQCQTAFSWRTGEIVQGNIHNPHYFQWLRQNRQPMERNPLDIICGREINHQMLYRVHILARDRNEHLYSSLLGRSLENLIYFKEKVDGFPVFDVMDNHRYRIAYLKNEIDQANFKKRIFLRNKHNEINRELRLWLLLFRDVSTDLVYNLIERLQNDLETPAKTIMLEFRTEWFALEEMVNTNLAELCELFKIKKRHFCVKEANTNWNI